MFNLHFTDRDSASFQFISVCIKDCKIRETRGKE